MHIVCPLLVCIHHEITVYELGFVITCESLSCARLVFSALVAATTTSSVVRGTAGHTRVGVTAHVGSGSGAFPVFPGESTAAEHTPILASAEGRSPSVSVQTCALETFWLQNKCETFTARYF